MQAMDKKIGELIKTIRKEGIAENTLIVVMADNGPMLEFWPIFPKFGFFRGGKGSFTEGGVRVPAFAWWPGVIEADSVVGDIIHVTDLYTTFARLGGAMDNIPTDRVIDGIDQTALLLNGDTHSRRDYVHIYAGPVLAATVKQQFKRHWMSDRPGLVGSAFYDLYKDPREENGMMAEFLWAWEPFDTMKARHLALKEKYPDIPTRRGEAAKGIERIKK
jgi:arylsulfatase